MLPAVGINIIIMLKLYLVRFLLILASSIWLLHSFIPHHHHQTIACFFEDQLLGKDHHSDKKDTDHSHHHDQTDDDCVLRKWAIIHSDSQDSQLCRKVFQINKYYSNWHINTETLYIDPEVSFRTRSRIPFFDSSALLVFFPPSYSMRGPPSLSASA
jgi:hypothetical protein